jgi:hypothetical protein
MGMEQADAKQLMGNTHFSVPYKDNPKRNRLGSRRLGGSWESCKVQAANQGDNATLLRLAEHKLNQVMIALRDQPFHWFSPSHLRWAQVSSINSTTEEVAQVLSLHPGYQRDRGGTR